MQKEQRKKLAWLSARSRYRSIWRKFVRAVACLVVFCTTYALILPAITMEQTLICEIEEHTHTAECWHQETKTVFLCSPVLPAAHTHDAMCLDAAGQLICTLPEEAVHVHSDMCYATAGHVHEETCYDGELNLICELAEEPLTTVLTCTAAELPVHQHSEECLGSQEQEVLICTMQEHTHKDSCYVSMKADYICGLEEHLHEENCYDAQGQLLCALTEHSHEAACTEQAETIPQSQPTETPVSDWLCGLDVHSHAETCYDADGNVSCTVEEHIHSAACLVEELDLSADLETAEQWDDAFEALTLTGKWNEDLLAIARTQIGYQESEKNVVLEGETLKGYTRYGAKYADPYADWNALFVRFCLDYAGVKNYPVHADAAQWLEELEVQQQYCSAGEYTPQVSDLVFFGTEEQGQRTVDAVGILAEQSEENGSWTIIVGDAAKGLVLAEVIDPEQTDILGYSAIPENPDYREKLPPAEVSALIGILPAEETARGRMEAMNHALDKAGFDNYLKTLRLQLYEIRQYCNDLTDEEKEQVENLGLLEQLEALCAEITWIQPAALTEDDAYVSALTVVSAEEKQIENGQTALFGFQAETKTYSGSIYGEGRVKLEFVLPLSAEQAVFDTAAMPWLENAAVTGEKRMVDGAEVWCQILTGYKRLTAAALDESAIPGSFTESAAVKVIKLSHGQKLSIVISAAMEQGTWQGTCAAHETEEKLTILSEAMTVHAPATPAEQQANYEALLMEYVSILEAEVSEEEYNAAANALWDKTSELYLSGGLSEEAMMDLSYKTSVMIHGNLDTVAEPALGNIWKMEAEQFFSQKSAAGLVPETHAERFDYQIFTQAAPTFAAVKAAAPSAVQIPADGWGGETISDDGQVMVSKTIEGTDTENVFDITLDIITADVVNEVYKEPDMAVVVVMDISNTMNSYMSGTTTTRYSGAVAAAENFIKTFAANNKGASKLGFVAFNTDSHLIFDIQQCYTNAQRDSLISEMKRDTGDIIYNYSKDSDGNVDDHDRFTNIEAGLQHAYDLLSKTNNENKYIIFLSDGFPTTYMNTSTAAKYDGYDPYDSAGTRFYDSVEKYDGKNRPCSSGTSYSDEGAIRARKKAEELKELGATIFSVGVDIGAQTIQGYVDGFKGWSFSVVDRRSTNYELGSATDEDAFKNWLKDKIGSGYYYDNHNTADLNSAFAQIFERIKELHANSAHLDWVATDPMPGMGVQEVEAVEFIGFYNKDDVLVDTDLVGTSGVGWDYENDATFEEASQTIKWDLKKSRYQAISMGNTTMYQCQLKYRIRLKNEEPNFVELQNYVTNDKTFMKYRVITVKDNDITISGQEEIEFKIPKVFGYLAELEFVKVDSLHDPLPGAEFTLSHAATCTACRGDTYWDYETGTAKPATAVTLQPYVAVSDKDGKVSFTNIPSGHTYILTETVVPTGYLPNGYSYQVTVSYDNRTITVKDENGNDVLWEEFILNHTEFMLPETGGMGNEPIVFSGLLMCAAALIIGCSQRRKMERRARR